MVAPYLVFIQLNGGLGEYRRQATEWVGEERARTPVQWPGSSTIPTASRPMRGRRAAASAPSRSVRTTASPGCITSRSPCPILALLVLVGLSRDGVQARRGRTRIQKIASSPSSASFSTRAFCEVRCRRASPIRSVPHAILLAWLGSRRAAAARPLARHWRPAVERWVVPVRVVAVARGDRNRLRPRFNLHQPYLRPSRGRVPDRRARAWRLPGRGPSARDARSDWDLSTWTNRRGPLWPDDARAVPEYLHAARRAGVHSTVPAAGAGDGAARLCCRLRRSAAGIFSTSRNSRRWRCGGCGDRTCRWCCWMSRTRSRTSASRFRR